MTFDALRSGKVKLSDQVRVSRHAARQGGSRMGPARGGTRFPEPPPHGDGRLFRQRRLDGCCRTRRGGSGRAFVKMMNNKARQIGMSSSTFKTPNGLPAAGQYTTARDMARLGYVYLKNNPSAIQYHRVRVLKTGGGHNEQKPAARGLPRCRRPENRLGHGFRLQYHFHRAARQYAPHRGHPRSGLRRAPQP